MSTTESKLPEAVAHLMQQIEEFGADRWATGACEQAKDQAGATRADKAAVKRRARIEALISALPASGSAEPHPEAMDEDELYTIERAADLLEIYVEFIKSDVMSADIERHPYLPEIEGTVAELRALAQAEAAKGVSHG